MHDDGEAHMDDHVPIEKSAGWEARKAKYEKYARHGKVKKLEHVMARQVAKAEKAKESWGKHKSDAKAKDKEDYYNYKCAKIEWTKAAVKVAKLSSEMGKVRTRPQQSLRQSRDWRNARRSRAPRSRRWACTSRTRSTARTRSRWPQATPVARSSSARSEVIPLFSARPPSGFAHVRMYNDGCSGSPTLRAVAHTRCVHDEWRSHGACATTCSTVKMFLLWGGDDTTNLRRIPA